MYDDVLIRFVTIGASIFITLATVTAVMMYYNTAKMSVAGVGTGNNVEKNYREDIKEILYSSEATGAQVKNILQYFTGNREVNITIDRYFGFDLTPSLYVIPVLSNSNINFDRTSATYIQIMKTMMPNQKFTMSYNGNICSFALKYP